LSKENEPKEKTPTFTCPADSLAAQHDSTVGMIHILLNIPQMNLPVHLPAVLSACSPSK